MSSLELRVFLVLHSLNQEKFGKLVGVSRQSVNAWCVGKYKIPQRVIDFCEKYNEAEQRED
jgi:DNA-binding XRE family transcriptional regulator